MSSIPATHRNRLLLALFTAIAALAVGLAPTTTFAILRGCRTDPIVRLSNGDVLKLTVAVDTDLDSIDSITYTIHAPVGTRVVRVVYTNGPIAPKERVLFYADQPANRYTTTTYINAAAGIEATATTTRVSPKQRNHYSGSISGTTQQLLSLSF